MCVCVCVCVPQGTSFNQYCGQRKQPWVIDVTGMDMKCLEGKRISLPACQWPLSPQTCVIDGARV